MVPSALSRAALFVERHRSALVAALVLAVAVAALYGPFVSNPLVYDDRGYFTGREFALYATSPFGLRPRFPAAFSIAFIYVLFGTVEAQRVVGLVLHLAVTLAIYWLIVVLQSGAPERQRQPASVVPAALAGAVFFALHPVAVYGAAYLAQRSIVLATLFAALSMTVFARGILAGRYIYLLGAVALYSVAVLSKEHAILAAAVAPAIAWVLGTRRAFAVKYTLAFLVACIPVAVFIYLQVKGMRQAELLGQALEPQFAQAAREVGAASAAGGVLEHPWLRSVLTQAGLFFRYAFLWLAPAPSRMAFDLRIDLAQAGSGPMAIASALAYTAVGLVALVLVLRRGRAAIAGIGLWWFWSLYLLEFSVVRFQEPFVLYRTYLWAPGLAIALGALVERAAPRVLLIVGIGAAAILAWQAHDRLRTFESGLALWQDSVAKLPAGPVAGGARPLYELGREYFYHGEPEKAAAVVDRCMAQYPGNLECVMARAAMLIETEHYEEALPYLERAIAAQPRAAVPHHHLGIVFEQLGCRAQARAQYEISYRLGLGAAGQRLQNLDRPGEGVLPPTKSHAKKPFPCAELAKKVEQLGR